MAKLLLISILIASVVIPMAASRAATPRLALRRTTWWMIAGICVYVFAVVFVFPRLM